jgi:hypothetical protein
VLLAFDDPALFVQHLQRDCCAGLLALAARHHPGCSLGMWVLGFAAWCVRQERSNGKAGRTDFSVNALHQRVAALQLTCPAVQWKEVGRRAAWRPARPWCLGGGTGTEAPGQVPDTPCCGRHLHPRP